MSEKYAADHDLILDETLNLSDLGVSAFKGKNATEGALGNFLQCVSSGIVPVGSYLLVESLDRLTRSDNLSALKLLIEILEGGITIATLADGRTYTEESVKDSTWDLMASLMVFERGHEESKIKSQRVGAAWRAKQDAARDTGKPTTGRGPAWLKLSADRSEYEHIPERVEVVQTIYKLAQTLGTRLIAKELNATGVQPFGNSRLWALSSVTKVLANRTVLGEYQPTTLGPDGTRGPQGDVIHDFYPQIIPTEEFNAVQATREKRRVTLKGRKGKTFSNLLQGLAQCGTCGSSMWLVTKGRSGGSYMRCKVANLQSTQCRAKAVFYLDVERALLTTLKEINFPSLIAASQPNNTERQANLNTRLAVLSKSHQTAKAAVANIIKAIAVGGDSEALVTALVEAEKEAKRKAAELTEAQQALEAHKAEAERATRTSEDFKDAASLLAADDSYQLRAKVNALLRQLISELYVSKWTPSLDAQHQLLQMLPNDLQDIFDSPTILVRYRLKEDTLQLKARCC